MSVLKYCKYCNSMRPIKNFKTKTKCKNCLSLEVKQRKVDKKLKIFQILHDESCIDCGESNPFVLEFDHFDREKKVDSVSRMLNSGRSLESILEEVEKCVVRCANCHRIKSVLEDDHYAYLRKEYKEHNIQDYLKRMHNRKLKKD